MHLKPGPMNSILDAVGYTPLVRLNKIVPPDAATVLDLNRLHEAMTIMADKVGDMAGAVAVLAATSTEQVKRIDDHEQRLRAAERRRYALPASVLAAVIGGIGNLALAAYSITHAGPVR